MADQKRWFKVWCSIGQDPAFLSLPLDSLARWTLLGAWIAVHGNKGSITAKETAIRVALRIPDDVTMVCALMLPNVSFEEGKNRDGTFAVTMDNWHKYQADSTGAERMKTLRSKRRREEKRREEKKQPPIVPQGTVALNGFEQFWSRYPRRVGKQAALKAWNRLSPDNGLVERILTQVMLQASSEAWTKDAGQFIPHPATWLNGKRWEDEVSAVQPDLPKATRQTLDAVKQFRSGGRDG